MKLSSATTLIIVAILLLVVAIILLALILGNQYSIYKQSKINPSPLPAATSTPEAPKVTTPRITLPKAPRSEWEGLDKWLSGTVLRAEPLTFGSEVTLGVSGINRGAVAEKNQVYIYFVDVVYDSRCPENSDCLVAGEAIVELQVKAFNKPTQTVYLSSTTGGKPDLWTYHGITDDSFMTPAIKEEIARGQQRVKETTYVTGNSYNDGAAVIDGYRINLNSLTPNRINSGEPPIAKETYRAGFVVTPIQ